MAEDDKNDWGKREIGALWIKNGKKQDFLSGKVGSNQVIIFRNKGKKTNNKAPDYIVYLEGSSEKKDPFFESNPSSENDLNGPILDDKPLGSDGLPEEPPF